MLAGLLSLGHTYPRVWPLVLATWFGGLTLLGLGLGRQRIGSAGFLLLPILAYSADRHGFYLPGSPAGVPTIYTAIATALASAYFWRNAPRARMLCLLTATSGLLAWAPYLAKGVLQPFGLAPSEDPGPAIAWVVFWLLPLYNGFYAILLLVAATGSWQPRGPPTSTGPQD
jgi:hypothetical protein